MGARQLSLFGGAAPGFDPGFGGVRRLELGGGAWVDYLPGWVQGHDVLFEELAARVDWQAERRWMYERVVDVPRLTASFDPERGPGLLLELAEALSGRYRTRLDRIGLAYYRDGRDSVAWHRDKVMRDLPRSVVAIVSLGEPRRFLLKPLAGGGARRFHLGWGDLFVLGGTVQRRFEHAVPKARRAGPRMSVMFRHGAEADRAPGTDM